MNAPTPRPDTTRLQRLAHSYRDSAALMAAVELGLFTRVARGAETEAAVARALDLTPTNAERLLRSIADAEAGRTEVQTLVDPPPDVA